MKKPVLISAIVIGAIAILYLARSILLPGALSPAAPSAGKRPPSLPTPPPPRRAPPSAQTLARKAEEFKRRQEEERKNSQRVIREYLAAVHMRASLPEELRYVILEDGPVRILLGRNLEGEGGFYFFSTAGQFDEAKAREYLAAYFADSTTLEFQRGSKPVQLTGMTGGARFRALSSGGEYFESVFFVNPATKMSHMMVVIGPPGQIYSFEKRIASVLSSIKP